MFDRGRSALLSVAALTLLVASAGHADDSAPTGAVAAQPNVVTGKEINDGQKKAVEKGLAFLAEHQDASGAQQGSAVFTGYSSNAAITALAGLAFMEGGNLPGRGKYGKEVQRCLDFILSSCQQSGLIASDSSQGPMYGHGFATLFLGEVYGMTGNEEVKEKLQKAVQLIEKTQNSEGGWRYQPAPFDADISVTICQVMALRAARDAGIKVEKETIDKSIQYVRRCQNPDGGFSYVAGQGSGSGFPRSAAGVAALYYAGIFEGNDLERGLKYLQQFNPRNGNAASRNEGHFFYGHYYAVQANFLAGGKYWAEWYPAVRDELIQQQDAKSGAWSGDFSEDYATAMALIILQMPNRYLPVYAGKGPGS